MTKQDEYLIAAEIVEAGNAVEVCWSADEAQAVIEAYLAGEYRPRSVIREVTTGV